MGGLVDRWAPAPDAWGSAVPGFVVTVAWGDIHPAPDTFLFTAVDQAIAEAQARGLHAKLRIIAGAEAPDWLRDGQSELVRVREPQEQQDYGVGRFWEPDYAQAYQELHEKLAERYDQVDELRVVTASLCTTVYAEPLIRQISDRQSRKALLEAGYTVELDLQCQRNQLEAHTVWKRTRTGYAVNPYQRIEPGSSQVDLALTLDLMEDCRQILGARCVLENNSIRTPQFQGDMERMYARMAEMGGPIAFQTAAPGRVGDLGETIAWAVDQGASAVELPRGYQSLLDEDQARAFTETLQSRISSSE